ncbi:MAG: MATE family efflux transporter, partial [Pseudomonadota bacterium]|nr:MATE family efflux transporter [Pseudomonadota bacterium]
MTDGGLLRPLLRLALPNIAATLIQAAMSFIEAWRLGALGSVSLAAVALVFPLFVLSNMWSAGAIGGAVSGAAARARGAGDRVRAAAVLRAAVVIGCVGGVVVGGLVVSLAVPMFTLAGGQGAVLRDAVAYGQTLFAGIVIIWLFNMTAAVSRGSGDMRTPFIAIVLAAVTYWVTSAPLIDGFGTVGSAMALLVGFGGGLAVMVAAILFGFTPVPLVWGGVPWAVIGPILRNGLLAASQSVATILAAMLATAYVARLGDAALAGYGIGVRLELLLVPVVFGIGGAAIAVTGAHVGGGRRADDEADAAERGHREDHLAARRVERGGHLDARPLLERRRRRLHAHAWAEARVILTRCLARPRHTARAVCANALAVSEPVAV